MHDAAILLRVNMRLRLLLLLTDDDDVYFLRLGDDVENTGAIKSR